MFAIAVAGSFVEGFYDVCASIILLGMSVALSFTGLFVL